MHNINKQPKRRRRPVESSNRKVRPLAAKGLNSVKNKKRTHKEYGNEDNKDSGSSIQKYESRTIKPPK